MTLTSTRRKVSVSTRTIPVRAQRLHFVPGRDPPGGRSLESGPTRIGISEKDDVQLVGSQHPGGGSGGSLSSGAVQDFHHQTALHRRDGESMLGFDRARASAGESR